MTHRSRVDSALGEGPWQVPIIATIIVTIIAAAATPGSTQVSGGDFELRESAISAGGGHAQKQSFELHGSLGQAQVDASSGGPYQVFAGLWTPDGTDFLFRDSWED